MKKRVVYYLRLSNEDRDKKGNINSNSIDNQRMMLENYLNKNLDKYTYVGEYIDDGYTGLNFDRPGFIKMNRDAKLKKFDIIFVKDMSRFGRNPMYVLLNSTGLFQNDIDIYLVGEGKDWRSKASDVDTKVNIYMNEFYSKNISDKVISQINVKHERGDFIGAFCSYGYKKDENNHNHLVIDEYPATIVKEIYDNFLKGIGKQKIARILNSRGVLCPSRYKESLGLNYHNSNILNNTAEWTYSTIDNILKNQIYAGDMVQGKNNTSKFSEMKKRRDREDWSVVKNTHEAIIEKSVFSKVQILLAKKTRTINFNNISLFAGFIKCGDCGKALVKSNWGKTNKYVCSKYKTLGVENGCSRHSVDEQELINYILKELNSYSQIYKDDLNKIKNSKNLVSKNKRLAYDFEVKSINKEIKTQEKVLINFMESYTNGYVSKEIWAENVKRINDKIVSYKKQLDDLNNGEENTENESKVIIDNLINENLTVLTREMLTAYVKEILVFEDKTTKNIRVEVYWTFCAC